jgi:hypothetical protein
MQLPETEYMEERSWRFRKPTVSPFGAAFAAEAGLRARPFISDARIAVRVNTTRCAAGQTEEGADKFIAS